MTSDLEQLSNVQAPLRLPDFLICGAARSGTTWLTILADRHPEIGMAKPVAPEPKFFLVDELYERGLSYYSSKWFDPLPQKRLLGEKSALYLEGASVPGRIHRALPRAKLIFMLRDPVERAWSHYCYSRQNGLETLGFEDALETEAERTKNLPESLQFSRPFSYFSRGLYAKQLARFLEFFPREQLLVLRTEDIVSKPEGIATAFQRFLGVEERPEISQDLGIINASDDGGIASMLPSTRAALTERYREPNERLQAVLGPSFVGWNAYA